MTAVFQALVYVFISPALLGTVRSLKARMQGRSGPLFYQPYLDLLKLFGRRPVLPENSSWFFESAPGMVFACYALLGLFTPIFLVEAPGSGGVGPSFLSADLIFIAYLIGLGAFISALAGLDSGSPLAAIGSKRELFLHFLAEPILLLILFILAIDTHTTLLPFMIQHYQNRPFLELLADPALWFLMLALFFTTLIETGRLPVDNPATHLELTMTGKAIQLEFAGPGLALMEWAEAMRLTFFLTLLVNLFLPYLLPISNGDPLQPLLACAAYLLKLFFLCLGLAAWEVTRIKLRLRNAAIPAGMALIFVMIAAIIMALK